MSYGYYSKRFSYESQTPEEVPDDILNDKISELKKNIEDGKLRNIRSNISFLKLAINDNKQFSGTNVLFAAYIYAKQINNTKSVDSIYKIILKNNFSYGGLDIIELYDVFKDDFKIILEDFLINKLFNFLIDDIKIIKFLHDKYILELNIMLQNDKLSKYIKGDDRLNIAVFLLSSKKIDYNNLEKVLQTLFGYDYVNKFGIKYEKLAALRNALKEQSTSIQEEILKNVFYPLYIEFITSDILEYDLSENLFSSEELETIFLPLFKNYPKKFIELIRNIHDNTSQIKLASINSDTLTYAIESGLDIIDSEVKDMFLF